MILLLFKQECVDSLDYISKEPRSGASVQFAVHKVYLFSDIRGCQTVDQTLSVFDPQTSCLGLKWCSHEAEPLSYKVIVVLWDYVKP